MRPAISWIRPWNALSERARATFEALIAESPTPPLQQELAKTLELITAHNEEHAHDP